MVIRQTAAVQARRNQAWDFLIDPGPMGRRMQGAVKNEIIELNKTCRSIAGARFGRASLPEAESTTGCA
jgi:hypothetical protein